MVYNHKFFSTYCYHKTLCILEVYTQLQEYKKQYIKYK